MGYTKQAFKGVSWMSGFRILTRALAFVKIAVLARVLTPAQFGIFGIASLFLALLETLTETGINVVLIQSKKELSEYVSPAWVVSVIRGIVIAAFIIILAPIIAYFFHSPASLNILLLISLVPFVRGFINPAEVKFQKELNFNKEFWFRTSIYIVDASVAVIFSLITKSAYGLVWGLLAGALLEVVLSFVLIRPRPKFIINRTYFTDILQRGVWVTGYTTFNYFAENVDNIVVGRLLGASSLGLYQMAYNISILPVSEISDVVSRVVFPVYAKISHEGQRLQGAFSKTIWPVMLTAFLLSLTIFLFPRQIVLIILGSKWLPIVPVLKVLAVYGFFRTVSGPASALFLSLEKQKYVTVMVFVRFATLAILIIPLVSIYKLVGAGYAQVAAVLSELPLILFFIITIFKKNTATKKS